MPEWLQCTISHLFKRLSSSYDRMVMVNCIYIHNLFIIILKVIKSIIIIIIMCWYSNSNNFFPKRNPSFAVLGCIIVINVCFFSSLLFSSLLHISFPQWVCLLMHCTCCIIDMVDCMYRLKNISFVLVTVSFKELQTSIYLFIYISDTHAYIYTHTLAYTHTFNSKHTYIYVLIWFYIASKLLWNKSYKF